MDCRRQFPSAAPRPGRPALDLAQVDRRLIKEIDEAIRRIDDGTYGSAVVIADGPVVVLVNDYPLKGQVDPATYIGLGLR